MKTLILTIAFTGLTTAAFSGDNPGDPLVGRREWKVSALPLQGSKIVYQETIFTGTPVPMPTLFKNGVEWYNYNYKNGDTRLTTESLEDGLISGIGVIKYTPLAAGENMERPIFFKFDIIVGNGNYTYRVYDMYTIGADGRFEYGDMYREETYTSSSSKPRWEQQYRYEMLSDMDTYIQLMITHLKQSMAKA